MAGSLLRALSAAERKVVLAHERTHLESGHHWHRSGVSLAVAIDPLLFPLRGAVAYATGRWADEQAAMAVGDRREAPGPIARIAILTAGAAGRQPVLAAGEYAVAARVSALLVDAPRAPPALYVLLLALLAVGFGATLALEKEVEHLFELARDVYSAGGGT